MSTKLPKFLSLFTSFFLVLYSLLGIFLYPSPVFADHTSVNIWDVNKTAYADDTGCVELTRHCSTIQAAINDASEEDTIQVAAGTYNEALVIEEGVTINGASGAILDGSGLTPANESAIHIEGASNVTIDGLNIQNFNDSYIESIRGIHVNDLTIKNLSISGGSGHAINVYGDSSNVTIDTVTVGAFGSNVNKWGDSPEEDWVFVVCGGPCGFADNIQSEAFRLESIDGVTVQNVDLSQNEGFIGVNFGFNTTGSVSNSKITANWNGVNTVTGVEVVIENNEIFNVGGRGINADTDGTPTSVVAHFNKITGSGTHGVRNATGDPGFVIDARENWWGSPTGPTHESNLGGSGDEVSDNVDFDPWYIDAALTTLSGVASIASANPADVNGDFTPEIGSTITRGSPAYLGRITTYFGSELGADPDTIQWKVTIDGPDVLTDGMVHLDEVGFNDPDGEGISTTTFHYPFTVEGGNLVANGSCTNPDDHVCAAGTDAFSLDQNDVFTNADKIVFDSSAPSGSYTITYELVNTDGGAVVGTHEVVVELIPAVSGEVSNTVGTDSIVISWTTDVPTSGRVIYDTVSHPVLGAAPNYDYAFSTGEFDTSPKTTSHTITITGLSDGTTYYFRTVSEGSPIAISDEFGGRTFTTTGAPAPGPAAPVVLAAVTPLPAPFAAALGIFAPQEEEVLGVEEEVEPSPTPTPTPTPTVAPTLGAEEEQPTLFGLARNVSIGLIVLILLLLGFFGYRFIRK